MEDIEQLEQTQASLPLDSDEELVLSDEEL
jgi:hypothetical protein